MRKIRTISYALGATAVAASFATKDPQTALMGAALLAIGVAAALAELCGIGIGEDAR